MEKIQQTRNDEWQQELLSLKSEYQSHSEDTQDAHVKLCATVVAVSYAESVQAAADQSGWSVSYVRKLRGESSLNADSPECSKLAAAGINSAHLAYQSRKSEQRNARSEYVSCIRRTVVPAPTIGDVAVLVGVSRQRVGQWLDES
jgi:hypothetical protein